MIGENIMNENITDIEELEKLTDFPELSNTKVAIKVMLGEKEIKSTDGVIAHANFDIGLTIMYKDYPKQQLVCALGNSSPQYKKWLVGKSQDLIEKNHKIYKKEFYQMIQQIKNHGIVIVNQKEVGHKQLTDADCAYA